MSEKLELINARYGSDQSHGNNGGIVDQAIRENIESNNGRIVLNGHFNQLFNYDPAPGQGKCCTMTVRYLGKACQLCVQEGKAFSFPNEKLELELINAWYGSDSSNSHLNGSVDQKVREHIVKSGGYIELDGNFSGWFGKDTAPGQRKHCVMTVRYRGEVQEIRCEEHKPLIFPKPIELLSAWYGNDQAHGDSNGVVEKAIRENIQRNDGRIVLDANACRFGFDPAPFQAKCCSMLVLYRGRECYLRAAEGKAFSFPSIGKDLELINARYGSDQSHGNNGGLVDQAIRENIESNNGRIVLSGNFNQLFNYDPAPGQGKSCVMHVRYLGQEHVLRAAEGMPFKFPLTAQELASQFELVSAWYGTDQKNSTNNGFVDEQIRAIVRSNNNECIKLDGNLFGLFQFDPADGERKCCGMHVRCRGKEHLLRAMEGTPFTFSV